MLEGCIYVEMGKPVTLASAMTGLEARSPDSPPRPRTLPNLEPFASAKTRPRAVDRRLAPRPHELGQPEPSEVDAFAIGLGPTLDFADGWDHAHGAECENRAVASELFPTEREARLAVRAYTLNRCGKIFRHWPPETTYRIFSQLDGFEPVHVVHVKGTVAACYDYRELGCEIKDAFAQLRQGAGRGDAWNRVRSHRALYGAHAARLPGSTREGHLFAFLTACTDLAMTSVAEVYPPAS